MNHPYCWYCRVEREERVNERRGTWTASTISWQRTETCSWCVRSRDRDRDRDQARGHSTSTVLFTTQLQATYLSQQYGLSSYYLIRVKPDSIPDSRRRAETKTQNARVDPGSRGRNKASEQPERQTGVVVTDGRSYHHAFLSHSRAL